MEENREGIVCNVHQFGDKTTPARSLSNSTQKKADLAGTQNQSGRRIMKTAQREDP